jgi:hypothetical protein
MGGRLLVVASMVAAAAAWPRGAAAEPQLVSYGTSGLRLGEVSLFDGAVDTAAVDRAQDLIWFTSKKTLQVIDLRAEAPKPVVIAKKLPDSSFSVTGVSNAAALAYPWQEHLSLAFDKKPRFEVAGHEECYSDPKECARATRAFAKAVAKIKLVGKKWLAAQRGRPPRAVTTWPAESRPDVVFQTEVWCDGCGMATSFGDTGYQRVVTGYTCGDSCATGYALYDPKTGMFTPLGESGGWTVTPQGFGNDADPQFYGDGTRYTTLTAVCTLGDPQRCTREDGHYYLGWVEVTTPTPGAGGLARSLATEAGAPVILVHTDAGVVARTADGAWSRTVVAGRFTGVAYDEAMELVWILDGTDLKVLDLRASSASLVPILSKVPFGVFEVTGVSNAGTAPIDAKEMQGVAILEWGKKPKVTPRAGTCTADDCGQERIRREVARAAKKVKIVGKKWLAKQVKRKERTGGAWYQRTGATPPTVTLPAPLDDCEPPCETAAGFGAGDLLLVIAFHIWESGNASCLVHDPTTGRWASPASPHQWTTAAEAQADHCSDFPFSFAADGATYLYGGDVCHLATGCAPLGGEVLGWLDGGVPVGFETFY